LQKWPNLRRFRRYRCGSQTVRGAPDEKFHNVANRWGGVKPAPCLKLNKEIPDSLSVVLFVLLVRGRSVSLTAVNRVPVRIVVEDTMPKVDVHDPSGPYYGAFVTVFLVPIRT
jgi:hypothetical protein